MWALILIASPVALLQAQAAERIVSAGHIVVQTDDVTRFFKVMDANQGRPSADELQHGYLDAGTDALRSFTDSRIGSMERLGQCHPGQAGIVCESENLRDSIAIDPHARRRCRRSAGRLVAVCALSPGHRTGGPRQQWWRDHRSRRGHRLGSAVQRRLDAGRCE